MAGSLEKKIVFRISEPEYQVLVKSSELSGMTVSQLIRKNLFSKKTQSTSVDDSNKNDDAPVLQNNLQRCYDDIAKMSKTYSASLGMVNVNGEPVLSSALTKRYFVSVEKRLSEIKEILEGRAVKSEADEPSELAAWLKKTPFFSYLRGIVSVEVSSVDVGRVKRMAFKMNVFHYLNDVRYIYPIVVIVPEAENGYPQLKKGDKVSVCGNMHIELSNDSVFPKLEIFVFMYHLELVD